MSRKKMEMVYITSDEDDFDDEIKKKRLLTDDDSREDNRARKKKLVEDETAMEAAYIRLRYDLNIEGIKVEMPVKPYPCQEEVVTAIIKGCKRKEHCLLESPTGSGKTLALLCGALAWQSDYENKIMEANEQARKQEEAKEAMKVPGTSEKRCEEGAKNCSMDEDFNLDEFDWSDENFTNSESARKRITHPKIFYGSRTHKQIEQVVKELRKTCYSYKNMTVLSSREFTCIQDTKKDKTQLCNELLDPSKKGSCPYYNEDNRYSIGTNSGLRANGINNPWDIEDLVTVGREVAACPYFAARSLMADADITFCPYNYIIDPAIRDSMQIDLTGSIIILDEAHNIEDICRASGSVSLTGEEIDKMMVECEGTIQLAVIHKQQNEIGCLRIIEEFLRNLQKFVAATVLKKRERSEMLCSNPWTGAEFIHVLEIEKITTLVEIGKFIIAARDAMSMVNQAKEYLRTRRAPPPTLSNDVIRLVEKVLMGFKMVTSTSASDYRVIISQTSLLGYNKEKKLEFMCMNPGVIFVPISQMARCVILASGTLAPMKSYQLELGVKFAHTIQANHVTPHEQVFVKSIDKGPSGTSLRATYQTVNTWSFQDDVGAILLTTCESVSHGILMFFSSYSVMTSLLDRWKKSGTWSKLARMKEIFQETRGCADLPSMMENYREAIRKTSAGPIGLLTGALLFAVFRGKVAEGIDFSDNEARCVLTVGIPYGVRSDPAIDMKCRYNDSNRDKGLLSGHEWYTVQAFRALNQALGRAIRHQNDWGAIILIDDRYCGPSTDFMTFYPTTRYHRTFNEQRNINLLPAWIRTIKIRQTETKMDLRQILRGFVARQIKRERQALLMIRT